MFQPSAIGFLAMIAFIACLALAVLLFRVGNPGSVARKLSLLLVVEGVTLISTGFIDLFLTATAQELHFYPFFLKAEEVIHTFGDCAMLALYPPFLASALQTRMTRPFAGNRMRVVFAVASLTLFFAVLLTPLKFGGTLLYLMLMLVFIFALVASLDSWYASIGAARTRARSFAIAFGVRDASWGFVYGMAILLIWAGEYRVVDPNASGLPYIVYALGTLLAVPLIAYGILRTHLFDIDLRIRWTIKQSTLAAIFVAIVYLLSEGADRFLSSELGSWAGLLASAIVVFFLAPLQKFAERVATVAMPSTQNTPEYAAFRKLQVYESAIAEAKLDGGISSKERALLVRLRDSLGISASDAEAIEIELQTSAANPG
jgi:hypothetical protein